MDQELENLVTKLKDYLDKKGLDLQDAFIVSKALSEDIWSEILDSNDSDDDNDLMDELDDDTETANEPEIEDHVEDEELPLDDSDDADDFEPEEPEPIVKEEPARQPLIKRPIVRLKK